MIQFEKWQGLGNHFIIVDALEDPTAVPALCDPRTGIGADGLIIASADPPTMKIYNADGSVAAMCGNGLRCAARYLAERSVDLSGGIHTDSGLMKLRGVGAEVTVEVGRPRITGEGQHGAHRFIAVDIGNPHAVFIDPDASFDLPTIGSQMQHHGDFPDGVNAHLVVTGQSPVSVTPFERGVGLTQACGTGAAASAFALATAHELPWPIATELPGGRLVFEPGEGGVLWMTGPASRVFRGEMSPD